MSKIAVNEITNEAGTGGPTLPNGIAGGLTLGGDLTLDTNGIYLGGTGSANYLDDYEEGTWTPSYAATGGGTVPSPTQKGSYVKIGNLVYLSFRVNSSGFNLTGDISVTGLPFSGGSFNQSVHAARRFQTEFSAFGTVLGAEILLFKSDSDNVENIRLTDADMSSSNFQNDLRAVVIYQTDS